jgi:hypothetical protein
VNAKERCMKLHILIQQHDKLLLFGIKIIIDIHFQLLFDSVLRCAGGQVSRKCCEGFAGTLWQPFFRIFAWQ